MNIDAEIKKAITYLEKAEANDNLEDKIFSFIEGIEILKDLIEEEESLNKNKIQYISNLKLSHSRSLLIQLSKHKELSIRLWTWCISLLIFNIRSEILQLTNEDEKFKIMYNKFINIEKLKGIKNKEILLLVYEKKLAKSQSEKDSVNLKYYVDKIKECLCEISSMENNS